MAAHHPLTTPGHGDVRYDLQLVTVVVLAFQEDTCKQMHDHNIIIISITVEFICAWVGTD